jgi:hypothetical protein
MKVLDLFSGLGGFSEAFVRAGDEVKRIENNPLLSGVPHTEQMCVLELRDILQRQVNDGNYIWPIDLIVASPPCLEFSLAYAAPRSKAQRNGEEWNPSMKLVEATLDIIRLVKPRYWVIENVNGSQRYFEKIGLQVSQIHGACVFYGKFPKFSTPEMKRKQDADTHAGDPLRPNKRALIPLPLSTALRKAIVTQKTLLDDYINP